MSRGFFITIIIIIIFFIHCSPVSANITLFTHKADQGELWASGEIVSRYENWNWFEPLPQSNDNNDYDYYFVRSRLALGYRFKWLEAFIQIQDTHVGELPNNSLAAPPAGPLGFGAILLCPQEENGFSRHLCQTGLPSITKHSFWWFFPDGWKIWLHWWYGGYLWQS